jgi:hypothetical protein
MSMHNYLHIGVYVECQNTETTVPIMAGRCTTEGCKKYGMKTDDNYCGACGHPTEEYQTGTTSERTVDPFEIEMDEDLTPLLEMDSPPGIIIWIPNKGGEVELKTEDVSIIALDDPHATRVAHISHFYVKYASSLQILKATYGAENVTVKWGVIQYRM